MLFLIIFNKLIQLRLCRPPSFGVRLRLCRPVIFPGPSLFLIGLPITEGKPAPGLSNGIINRLWIRNGMAALIKNLLSYTCWTFTRTIS